MPIDWEWIDLGDTELVDTLDAEWTKAVFVLSCEGGTYEITGTAVSFSVNYAVVADLGTYTITGSAVSLLTNYRLTCEVGSYVVTGSSVDLISTEFSWEWTDTLDVDYVDTLATEWTKKSDISDYILVCAGGSYGITGTDISFLYNRAVQAESATYILAGTDASLITQRKIVAAAGSYAITGAVVNLFYDRVLDCAAGSYVLTGTDILVHLTMAIESGSYVVTGSSVDLVYSAVVVTVRRRGLLMGVY